jgi:hypothetical protein
VAAPRFCSVPRYSPCGTPDTIAEFLAPYVSAGCRTFNLLACAEHLDAAVAGISEVRRLLERESLAQDVAAHSLT